MLSAYVINKTGTTSACVVSLMLSPVDEGDVWIDSEDFITGEGHIDAHLAIARRACLKVTGAEGVAGTVTAYLFSA